MPKVIKAFLIIIFVSVAFLYLKINYFNTTNTDQDNEISLSMYKVPKDVAAALDKARTTGLPVLGIRSDGPSYVMPVLLYHYVEYVKDKGDTIRMSLDVPPSVFETQIKTLVDGGYTFLTPMELADILDGIIPIPDKPVILTFDDGYRDFYTDVFPIIKKYKIKVGEYIISGFIGRPNYMTESQIKEIAASGYVEIGSHSVHHYALAGISQKVAADEIGQSKIQLESLIGKPVTTFAYPYGSFDLYALQTAKQSGYRIAFATIPGISVGNFNRFFVSRLRPGYATGQGLINLIEGK